MNKVDVFNAWDELVALFPANYAQIAEELGVMRKNRADKDLLQAIRVLFIHLGAGYSLKETALRAEMSKISTISSVALYHRLKKFGPFFRAMCDELMLENHKLTLHEGKRIKIVDASTVSEPGQTGSTFRLHLSFSLPELVCDYMELTPTKGVGSGETLKKFPVRINDLYLADAGYCHFGGIEHVVNSGGDVCVRVNRQALHFYNIDGDEISLKDWIESQNLTTPLKAAGMTCLISGANRGSRLEGRICVVKKDEQVILEAQKKLKRRAQKDSCGGTQVKISPETEFLQEYVILFTTLEQSDCDNRKVCDLYRIRWQIELLFKRLKSLLNLGHLPKTTSASSEAWLYGKLFIALLIEKIIVRNSAFSPWQDSVRRVEKQYVAFIRFCYACCPAIDFADSQFEHARKLLV